MPMTLEKLIIQETWNQRSGKRKVYKTWKDRRDMDSYMDLPKYLAESGAEGLSNC